MTHPLYFAYGSNLSLRQMGARCPSAMPQSRATLEAHRLEFAQPHAGWGGGVASVVPDARAEVPGVVYRLSQADLERLDGFEPVASARYARRWVTVRDEGGGDIGCWTYIGAVFPDSPYAPSARYLETLIEGAIEHGLPSSHVAWLRAQG